MQRNQSRLSQKISYSISNRKNTFHRLLEARKITQMRLGMAAMRMRLTRLRYSQSSKISSAPSFNRKIKLSTTSMTKLRIRITWKQTSKLESARSKKKERRHRLINKSFTVHSITLLRKYEKIVPKYSKSSLVNDTMYFPIKY
jgi:hypothetical protein